MKRRKKFAAALALILAILMILGVLIPALATGADDSYQQQLEGLEDDQSELEKQRKKQQELFNELAGLSKEKQAKIDELEAQIADLTKQVEEVDSRILEQETIIEGLNFEIALKEQEIETEIQNLARAQEDEDNYARLLNERIKAMYETSDTGFLELLLHADSITDLICKVEYIRQVYQYDKTIVSKLRAVRIRIAEYKESIEMAKMELEEDRAFAQQKERELETIRAEKQLLMDEMSAEELKVEQQLMDLIKQSEEKQAEIEGLNEEIAKIEKEIKKVKAAEAERRRKEEERLYYAAKNSKLKKVGELSFFWPLYGYPSVNAGGQWGYWQHPVTGAWTKHYGCDIGAPNGTQIHAVETGRVIIAYTSGWNNGYGNLIVIQHEGGIQTWYGHCSRVNVRPGDYVSRGDLIGWVGSTGNSTGDHLHLELIISGKDVNPEEYIPRCWPNYND